MNHPIVLKFGGTSVGSVERIQAVAKRIQEVLENGEFPVVVVSAMAGETNRLVDLTKQVSKNPFGEEYDFVLASGEQVAAGLLSLALREKGLNSRPLTGWQAGVQTQSSFSKARIETVDIKTIQKCIDDKTIPVVTGFQGVDSLNRITTLGRGGSDTSAVAIAAALGIEKTVKCDIFTDVDGVFTADPRIVSDALKLEKISYPEMLELSAGGSKVMHVRSIEMGAKFNVPLQVRSSFSKNEGTQIMPDTTGFERGRVTAIATDAKVAQITLTNLPNRSGVAYEIYGLLNDHEVSPDFLSQAEIEGGLAQVSFVVPEDEVSIVEKLFESRWALSFHEAELRTDLDVARLTLVGLGLQNQPEIQKRALQIFSELKIDLRGLSNGEMKLGFLFSQKRLTEVAQRLHSEWFTRDQSPKRPVLTNG